MPKRWSTSIAPARCLTSSTVVSGVVASWLIADPPRDRAYASASQAGMTAVIGAAQGAAGSAERESEVDDEEDDHEIDAGDPRCRRTQGRCRIGPSGPRPEDEIVRRAQHDRDGDKDDLHPEPLERQQFGAEPDVDETGRNEKDHRRPADSAE